MKTMLYEIPEIKYVDTKALEEATACLSKYGSKSKILAGGTDLLGLVKDRITGPQLPFPEVLVNIKNIPNLREITFNENHVTVGATTILTDIKESPVIRERLTALSEAAAQVATLQIRNVGTLGGNLCQRPWCAYFRSPHFNCYKKGGKLCYAIAGDNKYYFSILGLGICVMGHPSDCASAILALEGELEIANSKLKRIVPANKFFLGSRDTFENILSPTELLTKIIFDFGKRERTSSFLKDQLRETWDFALVNVAVSISWDGEKCDTAKIILGGVAPFPYEIKEAEELIQGKEVTSEMIRAVSDSSVKGAHPLRLNAYKIAITKTLVRKALQVAVERRTQQKAQPSR